MQEKMTVLNPLDSRYRTRTELSRKHFSQENIIELRCRIEVLYFFYLLEDDRSPFYDGSSYNIDAVLDAIFPLRPQDYERIRVLESEVKHDVIAVIEFVVKRLHEVMPMLEDDVRKIVHFSLTSQDVVDVADVIALENFMYDYLKLIHSNLLRAISKMKTDHERTVLMSMTHGQPAVPTTFYNFMEYHWKRIDHFVRFIGRVEPTVKFSGATGGANSFRIFFKYPDEFLQGFVQNVLSEDFNLTLSKYGYATQISPYVDRSALFGYFVSLCACCIDFCRDLWGMNSRKLFVGGRENSSSSTMPTKSNPISLENAESNFKVAMMWFQQLQTDLLMSRDQRDLTGSSLYRNVGVAFGHMELATRSLGTFLSTTGVNVVGMRQEVKDNPECMSEYVFLTLKRHNIKNARDITNDIFVHGTVSLYDLVDNEELSLNIAEMIIDTIDSIDYLPLLHD